jgi:fatty-acyl-CoA synthase
MPPASTQQDTRLYQGVFQPHMLIHALSYELDRPVLYTEDDGVFTAGNLRDLSSRYCQALEACGLQPGTRVGLLSGNRPEVLHVTHACMLNEYVYVPLYPRGSVSDWAHVAQDAGLDVLIFDPGKFEASAAEIREQAPALRHLLALGKSQVGIDLCAQAERFQPRGLPVPVLRGDELYRLSYSGGTTGKPKAIMGTHSYAMTTLAIQLAEWEWPREIRQLLCAPLSHSGAAVMMPTLLRGGSVWMQSGFDPLSVLQAIEKHRITCMLLVPTMIYALLDHPRLHEFDLSSLETIFYGASAISPARLREGIRKFGPVFFQFYGQAEAPMSVTVLRRAEHDVNDTARLASCGRPVPWVHVALLDNDCHEVADGEPGEICVRGPLVMAGYLDRPELTKEVFTGGWLHTGDVATRDERGFFRIVDRKKDMIISGGFNVYPREIEDILSAHPSVAQCAVIGVPDERWGEAVKAVVVLRPRAKPDAAELVALVREKKGPVQAPKSVDFVDSIPVTAVGKPDKKALRARYANATA